ncbi:MAG: phosphatase PAP2 family protein [Alphaproteobacteria bacterium]|nr:phosphatase PAP2 family protein [Alphaproteobacteria bacterium]
MVARADAAVGGREAARGRRAGAALIFVAVALLAAVPFLVKPEIDLIVAHWIWRAQGGRFLEPTGWFYPIYVGLTPLIYAIAAAVAALGAWNLLRRTRLLGLDLRVGAFILLSLALGPGLVTEIALKDNWGRARPRDIVEFGGTRQFTPAFRPADQCARNCSFVSGHAALTFAFAPFALLAAAGRRRAAMTAVAAAGAFVGAMRMLQGAHFLSDVVFAGFVVIGIALALAALILPAGRR